MYACRRFYSVTTVWCILIRTNPVSAEFLFLGPGVKGNPPPPENPPPPGGRIS